MEFLTIQHIFRRPTSQKEQREVSAVAPFVIPVSQAAVERGRGGLYMAAARAADAGRRRPRHHVTRPQLGRLVQNSGGGSASTRWRRGSSGAEMGGRRERFGTKKDGGRLHLRGNRRIARRTPSQKKNPEPPGRNDKGVHRRLFVLFFYDGRWFKGAVLFIHPCNPVCFILIAANGIYDKSWIFFICHGHITINTDPIQESNMIQKKKGVQHNLGNIVRLWSRDYVFINATYWIFISSTLKLITSIIKLQAP